MAGNGSKSAAVATDPVEAAKVPAPPEAQTTVALTIDGAPPPAAAAPSGPPGPVPPKTAGAFKLCFKIIPGTSYSCVLKRLHEGKCKPSDDVLNPVKRKWYRVTDMRDWKRPVAVKGRFTSLTMGAELDSNTYSPADIAGIREQGVTLTEFLK